MTDSAAPFAPTRLEALRFWLKLGCISFGGPAGQIATMHLELVERRRWISEARFLHALNYCMVLPGPEAQQLATYIGWLLHRTWGGLVAGGLFVLPSLLLLCGLSWVYAAHGHDPWLAAMFGGVKPAVVAIVLHAAWRIGSRTLKSPLLIGVAVLAFAATAWGRIPFPLTIATAALIGWTGRRLQLRGFKTGGPHHAANTQPHAPAVIDDDTPPPAHAAWSRGGLIRVVGSGLAIWLAAAGLLFAADGGHGPLSSMGQFFSKAALLTFGGAYAVLPYVFEGSVIQHHWLSAAQMLDGLALGETTPGPLIMVVAFVGFLGGWNQALSVGGDAALLGIAGAMTATFFTFLPSFVFILAGAPWVERTRGLVGLAAPLTAVSAAVVGVNLDLALFFARQVFWPQGLGAAPEGFALLVFAAAALALLRGVGVMPVIGAALLAGLARQALAG